jgi:hypothetical protein
MGFPEGSAALRAASLLDRQPRAPGRTGVETSRERIVAHFATHQGVLIG